MDLEWPDEPQLAVYVNKLAKVSYAYGKIANQHSDHWCYCQ